MNPYNATSGNGFGTVRITSRGDIGGIVGKGCARGEAVFLKSDAEWNSSPNPRLLLVGVPMWTGIGLCR